MKLDDDFDLDDREYYDYHGSRSKNSSYIYTLCVASVVILAILITVFLSNDNNRSSHNTGNSGAASVSSQYNNIISQAEQEHANNSLVSKSVDELISGSTLTADDLDFWHDYDDKKTGSASANSGGQNSHDAYVSGKDSEVSGSTDNTDGADDANDPSKDGKHTLIKYANGQEEWLDLNPYLTLNTYNYANLVYVNNIMKYYDNHVNVSYAGLDLTKNDDYVDFNKVKRAGIDFVMLRVGMRGYSTGDIMPDESYEDNYRRAREAGLDVGVFFFSQAVSKEEAIEEAQFVINTISENSIQYPVVYYLEDVNSNDVRTKDVNQLLRTNIAINFMDTIRNAGYIPMVYGNKEYLLKKLSFGSLIGYDVWMGEEGDVPDFPYQYNMWRYTSLGKIDGVTGAARLSICFTNYVER